MRTGSLNKLSAGSVKAAAEGMHSDGGGLFLRVAGPRRSWVFRSTSVGRKRERGLGPAASRQLGQCPRQGRRSARRRRRRRRSDRRSTARQRPREPKLCIARADDVPKRGRRLPARPSAHTVKRQASRAVAIDAGGLRRRPDAAALRRDHGGSGLRLPQSDLAGDTRDGEPQATASGAGARLCRRP